MVRVDFGPQRIASQQGRQIVARIARRFDAVDIPFVGTGFTGDLVLVDVAHDIVSIDLVSDIR